MKGRLNYGRIEASYSARCGQCGYNLHMGVQSRPDAIAWVKGYGWKHVKGKGWICEICKLPNGA